MNNNYIDINFEEVEGYDQLTQEQKELFRDIYKRHNSVADSDCKEDWLPTKVTWVEETPVEYSYIKVDFKNGEWLHFTSKGWY